MESLPNPERFLTGPTRRILQSKPDDLASDVSRDDVNVERDNKMRTVRIFSTCVCPQYSN